jgi:catechol 2,3-dioxygenase-like lactoylglutathione lyase family enzyme
VFDHVTIRVADRAASERFYLTVLGALDIEQDRSGPDLAEWDDFSLAAAASPGEVTRGLHIGFAAPSRAHVDRFWRSGTAAGHRDDGPPGPRAEYREDYYGAFLLDPDGNSTEAVHHGVLRQGGVIDHVWIRVSDLSAARDFYGAVAPHVGYQLSLDSPERVRFSAGPPGRGSFSIVTGPPTAHLHLAFPAPDDATVGGFHRALVEAGHPDNGAPGERPQYHAGYYGAFVLDPDGNNIEMVNHNRG